MYIITTNQSFICVPMNGPGGFLLAHRNKTIEEMMYVSDRRMI